MAITYHAGRRIQGLSTEGVSTATYSDDFDYASQSTADAKWVPATTLVRVDVSNDRLGYTIERHSTNDICYYDLGTANISETAWVCRFKLVTTGVNGGGSSHKQGFFGLSSGTGSWSTSVNKIGFHHQISSNSAERDIHPAYAGSSNYGAGSQAELTTQVTASTYYYQLSRLSSSQYRITISSTDAYNGDVEDETYTNLSGITSLRYFVIVNANDYTISGSLVGYIDDLKFYNGVTSVATTTQRPTNVQVGSRFEETDTRKMYHYEPSLSLTGLKAYYKFDNASGNLVNQAASVGSSSSNSVDMVNTNVTLNETGLFGKSYLYSATDTSNDGSASTNWEFTYGDGAAFTVVCWYKQTGASEAEQCPIFDTSDSGNGLGSLLKVNGSNGNRQVTCKTHNGSASETISTATGTFPSDTNWHFIAMRTTLGGAVKFTIDGSTTATTSSNNGTDGTSHNRMGIGNIYRSTSIACRGNLDELSFWDRILTDAEITSLYNTGSGKEISTTWSEEGT